MVNTGLDDTTPLSANYSSAIAVVDTTISWKNLTDLVFGNAVRKSCYHYDNPLWNRNKKAVLVTSCMQTILRTCFFVCECVYVFACACVWEGDFKNYITTWNISDRVGEILIWRSITVKSVSVFVRALIVKIEKYQKKHLYSMNNFKTDLARGNYPSSSLFKLSSNMAVLYL